MTEITEIRNGRVVTPNGVIEDGRVVITASRIAEVGRSETPQIARARTVDADGMVVMPGLVDLHGDDIERERYPRSGARVDAHTALAASDRANVCAGITTKFHAIAFEETPDEDRSIDEAKTLTRTIAEAENTLGDNRIHARCELSEESVSAVESLPGTLPIDLLSVMHHAPGDGQFDGDEFRDHYVDEHDCTQRAAADLALKRQRMSETALDGLIERLAALAAEREIPLASHDDESPEMVDRMARVGTSISEFPVTMAAAERAVDCGVVTTMGAPNLVRGRSLWGNLSASEAIRAGAVDALCADYHPPSLLEAPFVDTDEPLSTRVARVTATPADAVGLTDRGRLQRGARADVIVVDTDGTPTVERVFVGGREVMRTS